VSKPGVGSLKRRTIACLDPRPVLRLDQNDQDVARPFMSPQKRENSTGVKSSNTFADEKDQFGLPVARVTFGLHDNDKELIEFGKNKVVERIWAE
jgi:hypothetical protein